MLVCCSKSAQGDLKNEITTVCSSLEKNADKRPHKMLRECA